MDPGVGGRLKRKREGSSPLRDLNRIERKTRGVSNRAAYGWFQVTDLKNLGN